MGRGNDQRSQRANAYRRLYRTPEWQALRKAILKRDGYQCRWPGCGKMLVGGHRAHNAPVVHHIRDHKGDVVLFLDPANLMSVCKSCHDAQAQSTASTGIIKGSSLDGRPLDPNHPWNQRT